MGLSMRKGSGIRIVSLYWLYHNLGKTTGAMQSSRANGTVRMGGMHSSVSKF